MLTIGLAEAQEKLGSLIELAELGETICIMRRGKQVAQITAIVATETAHTLAEVQALPRWTAPALTATDTPPEKRKVPFAENRLIDERAAG